MNVYYIPTLVSGILCLILSIINWLLRGQENINRVFAFYTLTLSLDSFSYFFWFQYRNYEHIHLWMRIVFTTGMLVPISLIVFFFSFTGFDNNKHAKVLGIKVQHFKVTVILIFAIGMVLSAFTNLMVIYPDTPVDIWDLKSGIYGYFVMYSFAFIFLYMLIMAIKSYRMDNNKPRKQFILMLAAGALLWVLTGYAGILFSADKGLVEQAFNYIGIICMAVFYFIAIINYQVRKMNDLNTRLESKVLQLENEITEREQVELLAREQQIKLMQADKMASLGILVSGVAHEINNPNNYMQLNSNNLSDIWNELNPFLDKYSKSHSNFTILGMPFSDISNEITNIISALNEGPQRIRKIVQTLKDFARKDPGNIDQIVDIKEVIEASTTILANMIKKATDYFSYTVDENVPPIRGNFQQLEQVIINLISNSCQALEDKTKRITVSSTADSTQNKVFITVKDEGAGIAPDDLKFIMDPFFTTKREVGGTGLGLSISYKIIHDLQGELIFTSELTKGTEATIILPMIDD